MYIFSGVITTGNSTSVGATAGAVKMVEVFGHKSFSNGAPTANTNSYYFGFNSGSLPYVVPTGGRVLIELGTNNVLDDKQNLYVRGIAASDGYYIVTRP